MFDVRMNERPQLTFSTDDFGLRPITDLLNTARAQRPAVFSNPTMEEQVIHELS
jgi:hypothetical protein